MSFPAHPDSSGPTSFFSVHDDEDPFDRLPNDGRLGVGGHIYEL